MAQPSSLQNTVPQLAASVAAMADPPQPVIVTPATGVQVAKVKKGGRCWKCAVNTHTTKDCNV